MSKIIASELRKIGEKVLKDNATRWNSIYIMIKSINKLSENEFRNLINQIKLDERALYTFKKDQRLILS